MNSEEAIAFLRQHQPMPSDFDITNEEGETFARILKHFQSHVDDRCIPFLIRSVSTDTGLGMYEHINSVLIFHSRDAVVPHLRDGLLDGSAGVKYRCCWWAADVDAWELAPLIEPLLTHENEDVRESAAAFLQLRDDLA